MKQMFKYHPNVWELGIFKQSQSKKNFPECECCGNPTEFFVDYIYAKDNVSCICPECVSSGKAADKYQGCFIADSESHKIKDEGMSGI